MTEKRKPRSKTKPKIVKPIVEEVVAITEAEIDTSCLTELNEAYELLLAPTPVESLIPFLITGNYQGCLDIAVETARIKPDSLEARLLKDNETKALLVLGHRAIFGK